ncbi:MAG TPA: cell division protein SepF, partial [Nitrososphaera sp.]|nr:cell division protein SepF [Nitrososphaera sp.]
MQTQKTPVYLKAITLRDQSDIAVVKEDIKKHMILIIRVTPLAQKDLEELRKVVEDLYSYTQSAGGDIARLGEERIVITPPG